jgi:hypothetical protein
MSWALGVIFGAIGGAVVAWPHGRYVGQRAQREHAEQLRLARIARGRRHPARPGTQPARVHELRMYRD